MYRSRHRSSFNIFFIGFGMGMFSLIESPDIARQKLVRDGYSDITVTGIKLLAPMCGGKSLGEGFIAKLNGEARTGYVCTSPIFSYVVDQRR